MRVSLAAGLLFLALGGWLGPLSAEPPLRQLAAETSPSNAHAVAVGEPGPPLDGPTVLRGPYLQLGTPTTVIVRWRTDQATDSRVSFGFAPQSLSQTVDDPTLALDHAIALTGLSPDTLYYYAVGTGSGVLAGGDLLHFFLTAPTSGTPKPTRIWVLGDSGTADSSAAAVRDAYYGATGSLHTDLWLMLGDNAYVWGTDAEYQAAVFDMYPEMLRKSVLWPTIGNHDIFDGAANNWPYYEIFSLPTQAQAGGVASATEAYYSFDHANAHFVVLDSQNYSRAPGSAMLTWLEADLQSTTQPWIIAYWHHPPYSKGSHDSDDPGDSNGSLVEMRENVLPILEDYGVDLVLTGHSHSYERSYLLDGHYGDSSEITDPTTSPFVLDAGDGRIGGDGPYRKPLTGVVPIPGPGNGAVYSVAGSSGQTEGGPLDHSAMFVSLNVLGSLLIDLHDNRLDVSFLDSAGVFRDEFTILKDCPAGQDDDEDLVCDGQDNCPTDANATQLDTDSDGAGDACDDDDDGDGVDDGDDAAPLDRFACRDADSDTCDDCSSGTDDPASDGTDTDLDGECDAGDGDDDGDGVADGQDSQPLNEFLCRDADADTCDDCSSGTDDPADDGTDTDLDGECDAGDNCDAEPNPTQTDTDLDGQGDACDADDDNDGVADGDDSQPLNKFLCRDFDADTCDDCVSGTSAPSNDGTDTDTDGLCNAGDPDDDGDGVADGDDSQPLNRFLCRDVDADTCDDCSSGTSNPSNDGTDTDSDGECDAGDNCDATPNPTQTDTDLDGQGDACDADDDNDGVADGDDSQPLNKFLCRDVDADTCDDCVSGTSAPSNDGTDTDLDGLCNAGDPDDDNDAVPDGQDTAPLNKFLCRDVDSDTCNDCTSGTSAPANDGTDTDGDGLCNAGDSDDDDDNIPDGADTQPLNKFICRDVDADTCDDCTSGVSAPSNDGTDTDLDGLCNAGDGDDDGDGVGDAQDTQPLNKFVCRDSDADTCDDCTSGTAAPTNDGLDTDLDGECDAGDNCDTTPNPTQADTDLDGQGDACDGDDDNDGVADGQDSAPLNRFVCRDSDSDTCDDCTSGTDAPAADGTDTDLDGLCNAGDGDDDNDGVADGQDTQPLNKFICRDTDLDTCDDCTSGTSAPANDGTDTDLDGLCNAGDPDDDGDGVVDGQDTQPLNKFICRDTDLDTCDDCTSGTNAPSNDGTDTDLDGLCNAGDPDDDNDGVSDGQDSQPLNRFICRDVDSDTCDDCTSGTSSTSNDGTDTDLDGLCNAGDPDDDNDGVSDGQDSQPLNRFICRDVDSDTCDDCTSGTSAPANDGTDTDTDGLCNAGDPDDDNDGVIDGQDSQPLNKSICRDVDADTCDDCSEIPVAMVDAHFNANAEGFTYFDDQFRGTAQPNYASGTWASGTLRVDLGGIDNSTILQPGMSGAWRQTFTLTSPHRVVVSFDYNMTQTPHYEVAEFSEMLISVDVLPYGTPPGDWVAIIYGDGNGGPSKTTGSQHFEVDLGTLPAGLHVVMIGGRNSGKNNTNESTAILIDNVLIVAGGGTGVADPSNDGTDTDTDGLCNTGDADDDGDGVSDGQDSQPLNKFLCRDVDADGCDDCTSGTSSTSNDGTDTDLDGLCNTGDTDDDGDGVSDGQDSQPLNKFLCRDVDADGCDDCTSGTSSTSNDGTDTDLDGLCNTGDTDDDNDGVADGQDSQPLNKFLCRDTDADSCDDCTSGTSSTSNDGTDTDLDGLCNTGDTDDDNDAVPDGQDTQPLNKFLCRDTDADSCDDCTSGSSAPSNDGTDTDADGLCNTGDPDDDNDGVLDGQDSEPLNKFICRDLDADTCDDCSEIPVTMVDAHFNVNAEGFTYLDNAFRGTTAADVYASGTWASGTVRVDLGGIDNVLISPPGMSGGWQQSFNLTSSHRIVISFDYNMTQTAEYENTEYSEVLISVDGVLYGTSPNDYVARITGDGNGGPAKTTGLQHFAVDLGFLSTGSHVVRIGGLNSGKNNVNESTSILIDEVRIVAGAGTGLADPSNDGVDTDTDGLCNAGDGDDDGDTVADAQDVQPLNKFVCRDVDADTCEDCVSGTSAPSNDGTDTDLDGLCNAGDPDDDNDAVPDAQDTQPLNKFLCRDVDADTCDDCTSGTSAVASDGTDTDSDGMCDAGDNCDAAPNPTQTDTDLDGQGDACDADDDNDAVPDGQDTQPLNKFVCRDFDADTCDDCVSGTSAPSNDGTDTDLDGLCNAGDGDDDNDAVPDGQDAQPLNKFVCRDFDADTCEDCISGTSAVANDGTDTDLDGLCNAGDPDDDNDAVADGQDAQPLNPFVCRDLDADTCDDCTSGTSSVSNDGTDTDADGMCNAGDGDDDNDTVPDAQDAQPLNAHACRDLDMDTCDDCSIGTDAPASDGPDADSDGKCDAGDNCVAVANPAQTDTDLDGQGDACDADDDGDGVGDAEDSAPLDRFTCRDADDDTCDDCSSSTDDPGNDGPDWDADGVCDHVDPQILLEHLLDEMVDLVGLTRMPAPPYVTAQASSYDRESALPCVPGASCWFENHDFGNFYGSEALAGRTEHALLDVDGPGVVTRIWSAAPQGTLRVYIDGQAVPEIELPMSDLLQGEVPPFLPPIARITPLNAANLYFPIPYESHCRITTDDSGGANPTAVYYHVDYRTYPAGTSIESFTMASALALTDRIEEITEIFLDPSLVLESMPGQQQLTGQLLAGGMSLSIPAPSAAGGIVRELRLTPSNTSPEALRGTLLTLTFDGTTTVQSPLGDFFGSGPGLNAYESLPMSVEPDGTFVSRWPMPFETGMTLALTGGPGTASLGYEIVVQPYDWTPQSLYFSASWQADHALTVHDDRDLTLVTLTGKGRYLGNVLNVTSPFMTIWWGEGDEKITIDDEAFPSHFGTGTEDYYGYGFASQQPFEHAYHNQTAVLAPSFYGRCSTNRWHVLDSIPFEESLRFDMEQAFDVTPLYKKAQLYDTVVYWYGAPGTLHDHGALAPLDLTLPVPDELLPKSIPGTVVEGEGMPIGDGPGALTVEEVTPYEDQENLWSGHRQMAWVNAALGSVREIDFTLPLPAAGVYRVTLHTTKSPSSGIFTFSLNGVASPLPPLDLWNGGEVVQESVVLGSFSLQPGSGALVVTAGARNPASCCNSFGLDALSFEPFDDDSDGVANDVDNCPALFNPSQQNSDGDGAGNVCDVCPLDPDDDLDQDGVCGNLDSAPANPYACRDLDADGCDDCSSGTANPANDGPDLDGDGACNQGDLDDDGDGVPDSGDAAPLDPHVCRDLDSDGCDDCTSGIAAPQDDGLDTDSDGACDLSDSDDDGDGVADGLDSAPLLATACRDADEDACDDCTSGTDDPGNDGPDGDGDGRCDVTDPEDDSDGDILCSGGPTSFLPNSTDPGIDTTWFAAGFVPGPVWQSGTFGVGYDDDPPASGAQGLIHSVVPGQVHSVYTRTTFEIADRDAIFSLFLGADYDDGFVAWINGVEVYRSPEMRGKLLVWNALAGSHESSNGQGPDFAPLRDIGLAGIPALQNGTNLLAIGVWNDSPTSEDLVLVPRLVVNRSVTRAPYLQRQTPTSVVVRWRTALPSDSKVLWGTEVGSLISAEIEAGSTLDHEVTISGLTPNTRYYYAVGSSAGVLAGGDLGHSFRTPPQAGVPRPTRIWVLGDSGRGTESAFDVRDAYLNYTHDVAGGLVDDRPTDLWLLLGDNASESGTDAEYQEGLFDVHPTLLRSAAVWPALGDRDAYDGFQGTWPYLDLFTLPEAGEAGGVPSGTERYYSFDHANAHVVVLDSTSAGPATLEEMASWLVNDLTTTNQQWILAIWHHPPYSKGSHDSDDPQDSDGLLVAMRETIVPILEDYGVDLVLAAHNRSYERSYLIDGHYSSSSSFVESMKLDSGSGSENGPGGAYAKQPRGETPYGSATGDGTVYVVAGSASETAIGHGGSLGGTEADHPAMFASLLQLGSLVVDIDGNRLDARFLDDAGAVADEFTIFKGGAPAAPLANFEATPRLGTTSLVATFTDLSQNQPTAWSWDFENDGIVDDTAPAAAHLYDGPGLYSVKLVVSNSAGTDEILKPNFICVSAGVPGPVSGLRLLGDRATMTWTAEPVTMFYDVVRGSLSQLSSTGDFAQASPTCIEQDGLDLTASDPTLPAPGQALFYLVRGTDCMNQGTFNSGGPKQVGSRDPGLAAVRCPGCGIIGDGDGDSVCDAMDNCLGMPNPDQNDADADAAGDACDVCPADPLDDPDSDGVCSGSDNCPLKLNPGQQNTDGDAQGNACDADDDGDGVVDSLDAAPLNSFACRDSDDDDCDDCTSGTAAPASDGPDADADGACDAGDNCVATPNPPQIDSDGDGQGDVCDGDDDGDSVADGQDVAPLDAFVCRDADADTCDDCTSGTDAPAADGIDTDLDGQCDAGDGDDDGDGVGDGQDSAPLNAFVCRDADADTCDDCTSGTDAPAADGTDADADGICNAGDNCASTFNPGQQDTDQDGIGDACDSIDVYPSAETSVSGSAIGTYLATLVSDDAVEVLTEEVSGLTSMLEHRWTIVVAPGSAKTFHVEGFRSESSDGDDFDFQYSTNGTSWTPINIPSLPLQDNDTELVGNLPAGLTGAVQIRVVDTNHAILATALDSVSIDELFVRSEP